MIKVDTYKGQYSIELEGNVPELAADACIILQAVYDEIKKQNEDNAEVFRSIVLNLVNENENEVMR